MSQVNDSNYPNQVPVAADYSLFVRDSDSVLKTATMQQLAELFASLATPEPNVSIYSANTVLTTEQQIFAVSGSAFNLTLPAAALNSGRTYRIFNEGVGIVTIMRNGSDTIAGAASLALNQYESVILSSDGLAMWGTFGAP